MMNKVIAFALVCMMLLSAFPGFALEGMTPPPKPNGENMPTGNEPPDFMGNGNDPEMGMMPPDGRPPQGMGPMGNGEMTPPKPEGEGGMMPPGGFPGMPGGMQKEPTDYQAVLKITDQQSVSEPVVSEGDDENAIWVCGGELNFEGASVTRTSFASTGGDAASFYGIGAAILATEGQGTISNAKITTDAPGGTGLFAYGKGVLTISDSVVTTRQNTSGGIHVAGGGTLTARNVAVETHGESSAAIRSDRGGGIMLVTGGEYASFGEGSPAVYVTADITAEDAKLTANCSEALCLEGRNQVTLNRCVLSGNMKDLPQNDNTWTVILYQSMSGDAEDGKGVFTMTEGELISRNGGLFYTTNTESEINLTHVTITAAEDSEYFLRCTGNQNARGWGSVGQNGAICTLNATCQEISGNIVWDSISRLTVNMTEGSVLTGAVLQDESCAGNGGKGTCEVRIGSGCTWIVTADSILTSLENEGTLLDENGCTVTVKASDGEILFSGSGERTVTVSR